MKKIHFLLVLVGTVGLAGNANAEICASASIDMPATTPTSPRFEFTQDSEVVIDKKTGLKWARCQWGHSWDVGSGSCVEDSDNDLTWKDALLLVKENAPYLGEQGWRLPNIKELASIVEYKCYSPAINNEVFPGTRSGHFWSNTYVVGADYIRTVNFATGSVGSKPNSNDEQHYLRLVKDAE